RKPLDDQEPPGDRRSAEHRGDQDADEEEQPQRAGQWLRRDEAPDQPGGEEAVVQPLIRGERCRLGRELGRGAEDAPAGRALEEEHLQHEESQVLERDERHQQVPEDGHAEMLVVPGHTRPGEPSARAATPDPRRAAPRGIRRMPGNLRRAPASGSERGLLTVPLTPPDSTRLVSGLAADASPGESLAPWT